MTQNDSRADPEFRYQLHGCFDEDSYENDLETFPSFFDDHGWPLFGDYDPYSREHPITGNPWYENPRIPTEDETDKDYESWFELAVEFESSRLRLAELFKEMSKSPEDDAGTRDALYSLKSPFAFSGNANFLRVHVIPELKQAFHDRETSIQFAYLWGEFREIALSLRAVAPAATQRMQGRKAPQQEPRLAQRKWYLHWLRHYHKHGLSTRRANKEFIDTAFGIFSGAIAPPEGFDVDWFADALRKEPKGKEIAVRELAPFLKKAQKENIARKLLDQDPSEEPSIPPIRREEYKKVHKE